MSTGQAPEPGTAEWLGKVTASKAAAILGASPYESPYSMWHLMKGLVEKPPQTKAQGRGHYLESGVLAWWRDQHPEYRFVDDHPHVTRDELPWASATPDLIAYGENDTVLVEAKTAADAEDWEKWGDPGTDEIPVHYLAQCFWQLALSGAARVYVPVLGPYLNFYEFVVEADAGIQTDLLSQCEVFYRSLDSDDAPPLDGHVATLDTLKRRHPDITRGESADIDTAAALEWVEAKAALKATEAREKAARAVVLDQMGTAQYLNAGGVRVARRQASGKGVALYATATPTDLDTESETAA